jgi:predicted Na+-dependent transporter
MILLGSLVTLGLVAFLLPRWFLFASSAFVRHVSLALITLVLGLSLGAYELGNIKRLPLTIAMSTVGRLLLMPLATSLLVFPLGIQLDAASVSSLLLIAASPSGYATIWIAALTNTTVRELAAMMTFSSVAFSALTIPLLLLIAAAVARFPSSVGVADYLVAGTGAAAILWYASLYLALVTIPLFVGCLGAMFAPPALADRLRRLSRPVSWVSIVLLTVGTMASARTARVVSGSRGVFIASLLASLLGLSFGLIAGRLAGHSTRVRRTLAYELAFPGLAVAAATAPAETTGLACAATLATQLLLLLGMNVYQQFRKGYLGESVADILSIQAFNRSVE